MLEVLEELPEKLDDLYGRMMRQIRNLKRRNPEFCRLVLSTVAVAYRPLHLVELAIVSGLPPEIFAGHMNRVREVVALCGLFLTVKENIVYVIHQSVKDYLSSRTAPTAFPSGTNQAHHTIFARSIQALSPILRRNIYNLSYPGITVDNVTSPRPDPLASLRYSCIHRASHFCDASSGKSSFKSEDLERIGQLIRSTFLY